MKSLSRSSLDGSVYKEGWGVNGWVIFGLCLALSCFGLARSQIAQEYKYSVRGRVVDDYGRGVAGAFVVVYAGPGGDVVVSATADAKGRFYFEERASLESNERTLYTTTPFLRDGCDPIRPPFLDLEGQQYFGKRIRIEKNAEMDVGDLPIQVYYGIIEIVLHSTRGRPLSKRELQKWRKAWVRVRNARGDFVLDCRFPRDRKKLVVALPEGKWKLEISSDYDSGVWIQSSDAVPVKRLSAQELTFLVPTR